MKPHFLLIILLCCTVASYAQPVWSPKVRAAREAQWMQDSLHLTTEQMTKVKPVLLTYQQQMDANSGSDKRQKQVMQEKDNNLKAILDKGQYKIYFRRAKQIRAIPKPDRSGPHQAY